MSTFDATQRAELMAIAAQNRRALEFDPGYEPRTPAEQETYLVYVCPICLSQAHGNTVWCAGRGSVKHDRVRAEPRKAALA